MTKDKNFKSLIRQRMERTGENYTSARVALITLRILQGPPSHEPAQGPPSHKASQETSHEPSQAHVPDGSDTELDAALDAFRRKTRTTFMPDGILLSIPSKRRALVVILLDILSTFDPDRVYAEKEVNAHLKAIHPDFARLRRELIDYRYLDRNPHTGQYWVGRALPDRHGNIAQETRRLEDLQR